MGSQGIRRRKPKRRQATQSDGRSAWPTADETPPVMWSPPGSGFEASAYSPAGTVQRGWWLARRMRGMGERELEGRARWAFRSALPLMLGFVAVALGAGLLSLVIPLAVAFPVVVIGAVMWVVKRA